MKLADLDASFVTLDPNDARTMHRQAQLEGAQGLLFDMPVPNAGCALVWFSNPRGASPAPNRPVYWEVGGTGLHDLTITPSIDCVGIWHGWVTNGEVA